MPDIETSNQIIQQLAARLNVADRLAHIARQMPSATAIVCPQESSPSYPAVVQGKSGARYATCTFGDLDFDVNRILVALRRWGVPPGTRLALLVRPGIEFVTLVFALLRAGMVIVLVDPGLGRKHLVRCLEAAEPEGFVAVAVAHAIRVLLRRRFPKAKWNVTVGGRRWFWGGRKFSEMLSQGSIGIESFGFRPAEVERTTKDSAAAIIFTSGSTGPPKGVLYTHGMFDTQVSEIQSKYQLTAGGVDLSCFPLFALFNSAMCVTTVLPDMDFSRPASADPQKLLAAANDWHVTQAFASPAVWRVLSDFCRRSGDRIPSLTQVFSCGAPVPASLLRETLTFVGQNARMHTPYGATECLPVSTIDAAEVLRETGKRTDEGAGVCVGRKFDSIEWRVIRITDEPIPTMDQVEELSAGEIGELIVRGPQVSPKYVTRTEANAAAKITERRAGASSPPSVGELNHGGEDAPARFNADTDSQRWHRTGDVGYLDSGRRFWYCGRKSQRVETRAGAMYTEIYEAIFNKHPAVRWSALVGVGPRGDQKPVMILEANGPISPTELGKLRQILQNDSATAPVGEVFVVDWPLPVDIRHNAKINREQLTAWATEELRRRPSPPPAP